MSTIKQDVTYYTQDELWQHVDNDDQLLVAKDILSLIPAGAGSILDVGCGKGTVTNIVSGHFNIIGMDISLAALKYVNAPRIQGDICNIPFPDNSFDVVITSDVIEHIPEENFQHALAELLRVSKRYVLISVPFNEILESSYTSCVNCDHVFHINWHQRSFNAERIEQLWRGKAALVSYRLSGAAWQWSDPDIVKLKNKYLGYYRQHENAVCPECKAKQSKAMADGQNVNESNYLERVFESLNYRLVESELANQPCASEIVALYDKNAESTEEISIKQNSFVKEPGIRLKIQELPRVNYIPNYPNSYMVASIYDNSWVLVLPRNFSEINITKSDLSHRNILVEMYDHLLEKYYPLYQYDKRRYMLGNFSPSVKGYFLKFNCSIDHISEVELI